VGVKLLAHALGEGDLLGFDDTVAFFFDFLEDFGLFVGGEHVWFNDADGDWVLFGLDAVDLSLVVGCFELGLLFENNAVLYGLALGLALEDFVLLGQLLVDCFDYDWRVSTSDHGNELF